MNKDENISPEKSFQEEVWYVLRKIKQRVLYELDPTGTIEYQIRVRPKADDPNAPVPSDHAAILHKLESWGAITQTQNEEEQEAEFPAHLITFITAFFYFKINQPKFDEIYDKYKTRNKRRTSGGGRFVAEDGWVLEEKEANAHIIHTEKIVFTFPRADANKYKYFKCLWINRGDKVPYEDLYEFETGLKHPHKRGENWRANKKVRDTINRLKKELKKKKVEIKIVNNKGAILALPSEKLPSEI